MSAGWPPSRGLATSWASSAAWTSSSTSPVVDPVSASSTSPSRSPHRRNAWSHVERDSPTNAHPIEYAASAPHGARVWNVLYRSGGADGRDITKPPSSMEGGFVWIWRWCVSASLAAGDCRCSGAPRGGGRRPVRGTRSRAAPGAEQGPSLLRCVRKGPGSPVGVKRRGSPSKEAKTGGRAELGRRRQSRRPPWRRPAVSA